MSRGKKAASATAALPPDFGDGNSDEKVSGVDGALVSHLASVLKVATDDATIKQYTAVLKSEGWDTPEVRYGCRCGCDFGCGFKPSRHAVSHVALNDSMPSLSFFSPPFISSHILKDFEILTVEELKNEPFSFKAGHLRKIAMSRGKRIAIAATSLPADLETRNSATHVRGQCSLCGMEVLATQPRLKDPDTGLYQHQTCGGSSAPAKLADTPLTSVVVSQQTIVAAAAAAREAVIAANQRAEASLAKAQVDAMQIAAAAAAAAAAHSQVTVQTFDHGTGSAASGSTRSRTSAATANTTFLPTAPKTKPLLPNGKHAFLSYQWDVQEQVKEIKGMLNARQIKCAEVFPFRL